jgi:hypothetical protein
MPPADWLGLVFLSFPCLQSLSLLCDFHPCCFFVFIFDVIDL